MSVAIIQKSRAIKIANAPFIASFSSRGPQVITPNILKVSFSLSLKLQCCNHK